MADTSGGYRPVPYIFEKLFLRATFACLYLELLKSYKTSKLTMLENATYVALWGHPGCITTPDALLPHAIHF